MTVDELITALAHRFPNHANEIDSWTPDYKRVLREGEDLDKAFARTLDNWTSGFPPKPAQFTQHMPRRAHDDGRVNMKRMWDHVNRRQAVLLENCVQDLERRYPDIQWRRIKNELIPRVQMYAQVEYLREEGHCDEEQAVAKLNKYHGHIPMTREEAEDYCLIQRRLGRTKGDPAEQSVARPAK